MTTSSISQMSTRGRTPAQSNVILVVLWLFRMVSLRFQCAINVFTTKNWFDSPQLGLRSAQNLVRSPNFGLANGQFEKLGEPFFWHSLNRSLRFNENLRIQHGPSAVIFFSVCQWNISISWATFYSESSFIAIDTTILSWSRLATTLDIPIRITSYVLSGVALFPFATPLCIDSCKKCYSKKFHRKNLKNYFWPNDPRKSNNIDQVTFVKFSWSRSREKSSKISITVFQ